MLDFELPRFTKGVLFAYFESVDTVQHMFWRYLDTENPLYEKDAAQKYQNVIEQWYARMDAVLGDCLAAMRKDDVIIVVSDHGFGPFRRVAHVNAWLKKNGYLVLKNPLAETGSELLADIDWSKTRAYAIGFGGIYINQKNTEGEGIVQPGSQTQQLKEEIARKLQNWNDEKNNQPLVHKVYKSEELFWGDYAKDAPDLYIGFTIGYRASWQTAMGAVPACPVEDNLKKWAGDHLFDPALVPGVIFSNRKITNEKPTLYSVAPTILSILGYQSGQIKKCDFDADALF